MFQRGRAVVHTCPWRHMFTRDLELKWVSPFNARLMETLRCWAEYGRHSASNLDCPCCGGMSPLLIQGGLSRRCRAAWSVSAGPREWRLASVWMALCKVSSPLWVFQHPDFSLLLAAATSVSLLSSRGWWITSWDEWFSHIFFYSPNSTSFLKKNSLNLFFF